MLPSRTTMNGLVPSSSAVALSSPLLPQLPIAPYHEHSGVAAQDPSTTALNGASSDLLPQTPANYTAPPVELSSLLVVMVLLTRRWIVGLCSGLGSVGYLWHWAVADRTSPGNWDRSEYAGAEQRLRGWRGAACRNFGICYNGGASKALPSSIPQDDAPAPAPDFIFEYAPYVYLHSKETFMPGDIGEHLVHTTPYLNYTPITSTANHPFLDNLDYLNKFGHHVYLTSDDDPENPPEWLRGDRNKPIPPSDADNEEEVGLSAAPGLIIWSEKGEGIIDAFYFYFYSFNLGNTVAGVRFGNHVGDWEHTAIRFENGEPTEMFFSEHSGGAAYEYRAVEKIGKRPVAYAASGSHANYATPGAHYYILPLRLLADFTDAGHLWDPAKNAYTYNYNVAKDTLTASAQSPKAPTEWFFYEGRWGDRFYPLDDPRQYRVVGQYHYVNGPTGPRDKNLGRTAICQNEGICVVQPSLLWKLEGVTGPKWDEEDSWPEKLEPVEVVFHQPGDEGPDNDGDGDEMWKDAESDDFIRDAKTEVK